MMTNRHLVRHVRGNPLRLVIPLQALIRQLDDGRETVRTADFFPDPTRPVYVRLSACGRVRYAYQAAMDGSMATVNCSPDMRLGTYELEITCHDQDGEPRRFMAPDVLQIVDSTLEAMLPPGTEFNVEECQLDAAVYTYTQGPTGTGVDTVEQVSESHHSLGINTWRMTLTDGRTSDFHVRNGETGRVGAVINDDDESIELLLTN